MNQSLLLDLYNHVLEVRVWNTKTKLSARARYDRPKAFRLPAPTARRTQLSLDSEDLDVSDRLVRRPSKLPVVSHDRVRGYKGGWQTNQASTTSIQAVLSTQSVDSDVSVGDLGQSVSQTSPRERYLGVSPILEEKSDDSTKQLAIPAATSNRVTTTSSNNRGELAGGKEGGGEEGELAGGKEGGGDEGELAGVREGERKVS